jgi:NADH-quinone oxidoreductase subunit K
MDPEIALLDNYLIVGALLFGIGTVGFLSRRNMIVMFLSAEMMLQGVSLNLVAWSRFRNDFGGQMLVIFIIRRSGKLDIALWHQLREDNQPPFEEPELAEEPPEQPEVWPKLAPAGLRPGVPPEQTDYRSHV